MESKHKRETQPDQKPLSNSKESLVDFFFFFNFHGVNPLPLIPGRVVSLFSAGKLWRYVRNSQPEACQGLASPTEHDLPHM